MNVTRIWEMFTGRPHQTRNADMVRTATIRLMDTVDEFVENIKPYAEADNPVDMLFEDIKKQRDTARRNDEPKLHS